MSDVTLSYKGSDILELSDSGSATLKTGGKYCEADIELEYVKPSGGGGVQSKFTGTVTFIGEDVKQIVVPITGITLTGNEKIVAIGKAIRTGEIVDGEVEWYQNLTVPSFSTAYSSAWSPCFISFANFNSTTETVYYSDGTPNATKNIVTPYAFRMYNNNNGGSTGGQSASISTSRNTITIGANAQRLCYTDCASEYEYTIYILCSNGTYD